jgi:hypothetical protein
MRSILLSKAEQNGCFSKGLRPLNPVFFESKAEPVGCLFNWGVSGAEPPRNIFFLLSEAEQKNKT